MKTNYALTLSAIIAGVFGVFFLLKARGDEKKTAYAAEVKGIVCQACASEVKAAFEKLPGAAAVEIKKSTREDISIVRFSSTSEKLTVEDCERALGSKMKEFPVMKVERE